MDAKRIIPIIRIGEGSEEELLGRARRLELAGADELLFLGPRQSGQAAWLRAVARSVFIPVAMSCASADGPELEETLDAGADAVVLHLGPADLPGLARAALRFGRQRLRVAMNVIWAPEYGWTVPMPQDPVGRPVVAWIGELGQMGAGEVLLSVGPEATGLGALCQMAAHLPLPVLVQGGAQGAALEALLHGADGWAYPEALSSPSELKASLGGHGLALR